VAWIFFLVLTAAVVLRNDCGIEATATPSLLSVFYL